MIRRSIAKKTQGGTAVCYVRVSSQGQVDDGLSLDVQRERLEAYCKVRGLTVARVVVDEAQSAYKPLAKRPGGREVLDLVARGAVDAVVLYKLDRGFRNAGDCLATVGDWDNRGVALHLVDMGGASVDTSTATGKMFLTMMAGFAEFERNQTAERTAMVLASKARKGEQIGSDAPFGWTHVDGRLIPDMAEQRTIDLVRQLRADNISLRKICEKFAVIGIVNRAGGRFAPEQITRMLRGPKRPLDAAVERAA